MMTSIRSIVFTAVLGRIALTCTAQVAAPAVLPPSLIQYTKNESVSSGVVRLFLYNVDNSYVELSDIATGPFGITTQPTRQGTYSYSVDPQDPTHARIVYDGGGSNALPSDQLYFVQPTYGSLSPIKATAGAWSGFAMYPRQSVQGGSNVSNRVALNANGSSYTGFVIQGSRPRWVLIRAVGESLASFGVGSTVSGPSFSVFIAGQAAIWSSSVWDADPNLVPGYNTVFSLVGAFGLVGGSDEAILLEPLSPGVYTAVFKAASAGEILCEVYLLPF